MVKSCCAYGCKKRFVRDSGINFHTFPTNVELKKKWILAIQRKNFNPSKYSYVCSTHFTDDDFIVSDKNARKLEKLKKLKKDAIPTLFDGFPASRPPTKHRLARKSIREPQPQNIHASKEPQNVDAHHLDEEQSTFHAMDCLDVTMNAETPASVPLPKESEVDGDSSKEPQPQHPDEQPPIFHAMNYLLVVMNAQTPTHHIQPTSHTTNHLNVQKDAQTQFNSKVTADKSVQTDYCCLPKPTSSLRSKIKVLNQSVRRKQMVIQTLKALVQEMKKKDFDDSKLELFYCQGEDDDEHRPPILVCDDESDNFEVNDPTSSEHWMLKDQVSHE